jgi:Concanavalin A-like lectin/glucanases superfamily/Domain of unknown function (DUF2341)
VVVWAESPFAYLPMQASLPKKYPLSRILVATLIGGVVSIGIAISAENYANWSYSADLTLDTSPSGANVTSTVTQFPILLRLTHSNFLFNEAKKSGQDFRVANAVGKHLSYQIERWDSTLGLAEIWIKTDSVLGNTAGQKLTIFWGNNTASDSSNGNKVFSQDYTQVWHLGESGTIPRANALTTGLPAIPSNFDGDESTVGIIGQGYQFDGDSLGDYLNLGNGYTEYSNGFTFSVWMYPTAVKQYSQILSLGNGPFTNNIIVNREDTTNDLFFNNYNGLAKSQIKMGNAFVLNEWKYITVTLVGNQAKIYRDGVLDSSKVFVYPIDTVYRTQNYLGKSNWVADKYFQGKLDEPSLSKVARSDAWIKLCYQNQRSNQTLVSLKLPNRCLPKFLGPKDTTVNEGTQVTLTGIADCAMSISWSVVSGPAPRILDPEVKNLSISIPRVAGDTTLVYRFMAIYADSTPKKDFQVKIKEFIPEPAFTLPSGIIWSGKDTLSFRPSITNLKVIQSGRDSVINWAWTLSGASAPDGKIADTTWRSDRLLFTSAPMGSFQVGLCLDNGGPAVCKSSVVQVSGSTSVTGEDLNNAALLSKSPDMKSLNRGPDALGRRKLPDQKSTNLLHFSR